MIKDRVTLLTATITTVVSAVIIWVLVGKIIIPCLTGELDMQTCFGQ